MTAQPLEPDPQPAEVRRISGGTITSHSRANPSIALRYRSKTERR